MQEYTEGRLSFLDQSSPRPKYCQFGCSVCVDGLGHCHEKRKKTVPTDIFTAQQRPCLLASVLLPLVQFNCGFRLTCFTRFPCVILVSITTSTLQCYCKIL